MIRLYLTCVRCDNESAITVTEMPAVPGSIEMDIPLCPYCGSDNFRFRYHSPEGDLITGIARPKIESECSRRWWND